MFYLCDRAEGNVAIFIDDWGAVAFGGEYLETGALDEDAAGVVDIDNFPAVQVEAEVEERLADQKLPELIGGHAGHPVRGMASWNYTIDRRSS